MKQIYIRCTPSSRLELVLISCNQNCIDWAHGGESFVRTTHHFVEGPLPVTTAYIHFSSLQPCNGLPKLLFHILYSDIFILILSSPLVHSQCNEKVTSELRVVCRVARPSPRN